MPKIDQAAIDAKKVMDLNNPPMTFLGYEPFPKLVYLHPKDKTQEHQFLQVKDQAELDAAVKRGYKIKPHVPVAAPEPLDDRFEHAEPVKK